MCCRTMSLARRLSGRGPLGVCHQVQERDTAKHDKLINHKNPKGITPLIAAANSNHAVIVGLLLEKGADRTLADKDGDTAASFYVPKAPTEEAKAQLRALLAK